MILNHIIFYDIILYCPILHNLQLFIILYNLIYQQRLQEAANAEKERIQREQGTLPR